MNIQKNYLDKGVSMDTRMDFFFEEVDFDYILETNMGKDFIEIIYIMGGDAHTSRVYGDPKEGADTFYIVDK